MAAVLLAACQSPRVPDASRSLQALTAAELHDTLVGNTLIRSGGPFWRRWDYAGRHRGDGTMTGRVSWSGGQERATGVWDISPDGLYCRTWSNEWSAGRRGCFRGSRDGDILIFDHVSGSSGDAERYAYRLVPGNPHDP